MVDTYNSITRFIKAARMVQDFHLDTTEEMKAYAFDILEAFSAPRTQWRIVYDNLNMKIHFFSRANSRMRWIDLLALDFSPVSPVKILDIHAGSGGNISGAFSDYTYAANRDQKDENVKEGSNVSNDSMLRPCMYTVPHIYRYPE
jgi:hypothetical protein